MRLQLRLPSTNGTRNSLRHLIRSFIRFPAALWLRLTPSQRTYHLFVTTFTLFLATNPFSAPGMMGSEDPMPTALLPVSIIRERDFDLDEFVDNPVYRDHHWENAYWLVAVGDHYFSKYPVLTSLLVTPLYLLPVSLGLDAQSSLLQYAVLVKTGAALLAAASAVLVYVSLRLVASESTAVCLTVAYAFGSPTWTISSQTLWQHAATQLLLAAAIYCLLSAQRDARSVALAGLFVGLAVAARPLIVVVAVVVAAFVLHRSRNRTPHFVAGITMPLVFLLWYNRTTFGSPFGQGYGAEALTGWTTPPALGLLGLLFCPSKGLLVYAPVFWLSVAGIVALWTRGLKDDAHLWLFRYLAVAVVGYTLVLSNWHGTGGWCFGPRLFSDLTPLLALLMIPAFKWLGQGRVVFLAFSILLAMSVAVQLAGLSMFDGSWYAQLPSTQYEEAAFWSIRRSELALYIHRFGVAGFLGRMLGQGLLSGSLAVAVTAAPIFLLRRRGLLA
jgi:hypothetical protein